MKLVTAAIIMSEGKVLIARRKQGDTGAGLWEFPGGVVEPGESLEECLARELHEELGVQTEIGETIGESIFRSERGELKLVALEATITGDDIVLTAHDKVEWVSPGELASFDLSPPDIPIAKLVAERAGVRRK
jgi:8-oxo-dGTP diphosphatase